jgi:hypothetical protein
MIGDRLCFFCLLTVALATCSREGVERWELPIERVRIRPSDGSFLVTVAGKEASKDFYIELPKNQGYRRSVLFEETDHPWETGRIEYVNRTHDVGRPNEGTNEEYTITIERKVPLGSNLYYLPPSVKLGCITLRDGVGRFIDAATLPDLSEFVDAKVARWTTLKYLKIRQGHDYWN